jgi:ankyrin repeat protein
MGDIFRAAGEGDEREVKRLLDADPALLERETNGGYRPLTVAAHCGQLGVLRLVIERGANINAEAYGGNTALHLAATRGYEEVVALLLNKGAQANSSDHYDVTPLMLACDEGHLGVLKILLQHIGRQVLNERRDTGWTIMHGAAFGGHEEVVRFLLLAGADPTIMTDRGWTPRILAEEDHYIEEVREGCARCVAVFQVRPVTC